MLHITLRFREKPLTMGFRVTIWLILSIICLAFAFSFFTPKDSALNKTLIMFLDNAGVVFLLFEIYILCALLVQSKEWSDRGRRKLVNAFSLLYLSRYLFVPVALLIPSLLRGFVGFLYFNLIPIIWYKFYFLPFAGSMRQLLGDIKNLVPVFKEFDLSKREQEILMLVLEGKSNTQIEDELFISYNTVKNHIYNIFQKTGVKTRHQLIHLISRQQQKY
jgi:DNA-binding CsgD family transcriptional regulator